MVRLRFPFAFSLLFFLHFLASAFALSTPWPDLTYTKLVFNDADAVPHPDFSQVVPDADFGSVTYAPFFKDTRLSASTGFRPGFWPVTPTGNDFASLTRTGAVTSAESFATWFDPQPGDPSIGIPKIHSVTTAKASVDSASGRVFIPISASELGRTTIHLHLEGYAGPTLGFGTTTADSGEWQVEAHGPIGATTFFNGVNVHKTFVGDSSTNAESFVSPETAIDDAATAIPQTVLLNSPESIDTLTAMSPPNMAHPFTAVQTMWSTLDFFFFSNAVSESDAALLADPTFDESAYTFGVTLIVPLDHIVGLCPPEWPWAFTCENGFLACEPGYFGRLCTIKADSMNVVHGPDDSLVSPICASVTYGDDAAPTHRDIMMIYPELDIPTDEAGRSGSNWSDYFYDGGSGETRAAFTASQFYALDNFVHHTGLGQFSSVVSFLTLARRTDAAYLQPFLTTLFGKAMSHDEGGAHASWSGSITRRLMDQTPSGYADSQDISGYPPNLDDSNTDYESLFAVLDDFQNGLDTFSTDADGIVLLQRDCPGLLGDGYMLEAEQSLNNMLGPDDTVVLIQETSASSLYREFYIATYARGGGIEYIQLTEAEYKSLRVVVGECCAHPNPVSAVQGVITDHGGIGSYSRNRSCSWLFRPEVPTDLLVTDVDPATLTLALGFSKLNLEPADACMDTITVYDTSDASLGALSDGTNPPMVTFTHEIAAAALFEHTLDTASLYAGQSSPFDITDPAGFDLAFDVDPMCCPSDGPCGDVGVTNTNNGFQMHFAITPVTLGLPNGHTASAASVALAADNADYTLPNCYTPGVDSVTLSAEPLFEGSNDLGCIFYYTASEEDYFNNVITQVYSPATAYAAPADPTPSTVTCRVPLAVESTYRSASSGFVAITVGASNGVHMTDAESRLGLTLCPPVSAGVMATTLSPTQPAAWLNPSYSFNVAATPVDQTDALVAISPDKSVDYRAFNFLDSLYLAIVTAQDYVQLGADATPLIEAPMPLASNDYVNFSLDALAAADLVDGDGNLPDGFVSVDGAPQIVLCTGDYVVSLFAGSDTTGAVVSFLPFTINFWTAYFIGFSDPPLLSSQPASGSTASVVLPSPDSLTLTTLPGDSLRVALNITDVCDTVLDLEALYFIYEHPGFGVGGAARYPSVKVCYASPIAHGFSDAAVAAAMPDLPSVLAGGPALADEVCFSIDDFIGVGADDAFPYAGGDSDHASLDDLRLPVPNQAGVWAISSLTVSTDTDLTVGPDIPFAAVLAATSSADGAAVELLTPDVDAFSSVLVAVCPGVPALPSTCASDATLGCHGVYGASAGFLGLALAVPDAITAPELLPPGYALADVTITPQVVSGTALVSDGWSNQLDLFASTSVQAVWSDELGNRFTHQEYLNSLRKFHIDAGLDIIEVNLLFMYPDLTAVAAQIAAESAGSVTLAAAMTLIDSSLHPMDGYKLIYQGVNGNSDLTGALGNSLTLACTAAMAAASDLSAFDGNAVAAALDPTVDPSALLPVNRSYTSTAGAPSTEQAYCYSVPSVAVTQHNPYNNDLSGAFWAPVPKWNSAATVGGPAAADAIADLVYVSSTTDADPALHDVVLPITALAVPVPHCDAGSIVVLNVLDELQLDVEIGSAPPSGVSFGYSVVSEDAPSCTPCPADTYESHGTCILCNNVTWAPEGSTACEAPDAAISLAPIFIQWPSASNTPAGISTLFDATRLAVPETGANTYPHPGTPLFRPEFMLAASHHVDATVADLDTDADAVRLAGGLSAPAYAVCSSPYLADGTPVPSTKILSAILFLGDAVTQEALATLRQSGPLPPVAVDTAVAIAAAEAVLAATAAAAVVEATALSIHPGKVFSPPFDPRFDITELVQVGPFLGPDGTEWDSAYCAVFHTGAILADYLWGVNPFAYPPPRPQVGVFYVAECPDDRSVLESSSLAASQYGLHATKLYTCRACPDGFTVTDDDGAAVLDAAGASLQSLGLFLRDVEPSDYVFPSRAGRTPTLGSPPLSDSFTTAHCHACPYADYLTADTDTLACLVPQETIHIAVAAAATLSFVCTLTLCCCCCCCCCKRRRSRRLRQAQSQKAPSQTETETTQPKPSAPVDPDSSDAAVSPPTNVPPPSGLDASSVSSSALTSTSTATATATATSTQSRSRATLPLPASL
jgi:hypothetical protein